MQADFLVLGAGGVEVFLVGGGIAAGALSAEDEGEAATMPGRGTVGVGPVDCVAVVNEHVVGLGVDRNFPGVVTGAVVGDALREAERFRATVRS